MMTFVNMRAAGLVVLATPHRVLSGLGGFPAEAFRQRVGQWFDTETFSSSDELREALDSAPAGPLGHRRQSPGGRKELLAPRPPGRPRSLPA